MLRTRRLPCAAPSLTGEPSLSPWSPGSSGRSSRVARGCFAGPVGFLSASHPSRRVFLCVVAWCVLPQSLFWEDISDLWERNACLIQRASSLPHGCGAEPFPLLQETAQPEVLRWACPGDPSLRAPRPACSSATLRALRVVQPPPRPIPRTSSASQTDAPFIKQHGPIAQPHFLSL